MLEDLPYYSNKIQQVSFKNVHVIIKLGLLTKRILIAIAVTNISKSFTYKTAAKTS